VTRDLTSKEFGVSFEELLILCKKLKVAREGI